MPIGLKKMPKVIDPKLDNSIFFFFRKINRILPAHNSKLSTMRRVVNNKTGDLNDAWLVVNIT